MKKIKLSNGYESIVDDDFYENNEHKWFAFLAYKTASVKYHKGFSPYAN